MTTAPQPATLAHLPALVSIHAASFGPREAWGPDAIGLQLAMPGVFGLIDARGGMLLARVTADEAEVLTLAVDPARRRQGIATTLLAAAIAEARVRGAAAMLLEVSVRNEAARALYRRAGFAEAGRRPAYYADQSDALILRAAI